MTTRLFPFAAGLLAAALSNVEAHAQTFERTEERGERGMRLGVWRFEPVIEVGARFDDNIFREESGENASLILTATPSATLRSDWRRHSVSLTTEAEAGVFTSSSPDDYLDFGLSGEGVLDATRAARIRLRVSAARGHEARGGDDTDIGLARPVRFGRFGADLTGQYAPGRLRIQPQIGWERLDFSDAPLIGGEVGDQDDRDRATLRASAFLGWRWTRKTELFLDARVARTDFDEATDRGGFDRDNTAFGGLVGARFEYSALLEGSVAFGLERRRYDDRRLSGFTGPVAEAALTWRPTRLITMNANLSRRIEETTIAPASGADVSAIGLRGRWSVRRFVDLTAEAGFENRRFRGAARTDRTVSVGLGAEWRATRGTTLVAALRHVRERSNAAGEDHTANQIALTARHRF